ncbi:BRCA1-associated protein 2-domain-containing protein [Absidia repens]|uniref:BRCA1-associated protein 2-domain-containing protein n=1 Tax=Absidia repens TaxID=90262 RepID=A0A1X2HKB5_9FUNG|nr:BRCA1-associated protein 2-domain-containing protein [Absidia repens]
MYYYHLYFSLYSSEPTNLDNLHLFDLPLPTHLVPQQTLDTFDTQYKQLQHQQQHNTDSTDTSSTATNRLYPRKRLRDTSHSPAPDLSPPSIDKLVISSSTSSYKTQSSPLPLTLPTSTIIHDDFRLGPIDIECIDNNYNSNPPQQYLCNLGYGILHLSRDDQPAPDELMPDMLAVMPRSPDDDRGLMTCTLAVPSYMTTDDFLAFVQPFNATVTHYRFIRDASPNKYMVMMKFDQVQAAYDYHRKFNGRPFHGMEPEICHIVFVASSPTWLTTTISHYPMLKDTLQFERQLIPRTLELPTCPVCLERLDKNVTGLLGINCQHSFDCGCLGKWGEGNCPVCLFSEKPVLEERRDEGQQPQRNHQGWLLSRHASDDRVCCYVCGEKTGSLWICLICGHIGCGRYQAAHAYDHYQDTGSHMFTLEIETQRVWDYDGDGYVHRLIQNTVDGKLVEFPGSLAAHDGGDGPKPSSQQEETYPTARRNNNNSSNNNNNNNDNDNDNDSNTDGNSSSVMLDGNGGWRGFEKHSTTKASPTSSSSATPIISSSSSSSKQTWAAAAAAAAGSANPTTSIQEMEKIEAMSMEYTTLLTSQLESQRIYYEDQLGALVMQLSTLTAKKAHMDNEKKHHEALAVQRARYQRELDTLQRASTLLTDQCTIWKQQYDTSREKWQHEKTMTNRLSDENEQLKTTLREKQQLEQDMEDELRDLTFFVQTRNKIQHVPEMVGGSVGTTQRQQPSLNKARRGGKKGKR